MATSNFFFKNRCIVINNNDLEIGNTPKIGEYSNVYSNYSFSSCLVEHKECFQFFDIVFTNGYYSDACIDYRRNDFRIEEYIGYSHYYTFKSEVFNEIKKYFIISDYRLKKCFGKLSDFKTFEEFFDNGIYNVNKWLEEEEEKDVNSFLNKIKEDYGYYECFCPQTLSNGEVIYSKMG